ncbi:MAG: hypothetical protein P8K77_05315 [Polaribacter sp.]|nr:hypothetical protein [Polaribacter sp.]
MIIKELYAIGIKDSGSELTEENTQPLCESFYNSKSGNKAKG